MTPEVEYSRANPSPRYWGLMKLYQKEHKNSKRFRGGKLIFNHLGLLEKLILMTEARSVLDYGCGKGSHIMTKLPKEERNPILAETWKEKLGVELHGYDPACSRFDKLPKGPSDGVVSFDTLEHIAEEDLPWVIEELFSLARKFVFVRVACFAASKRFDGTKIDMHVTVRPPEWWVSQFERVAVRFPAVQWHLFTDTSKPITVGWEALGEETGAVLASFKSSDDAPGNASTISQCCHLLEAFNFVKDWTLAVDGGAFVGWWSWLMAQRFGCVHAFEPEPRNFRSLAWNLREVANVVLHREALGDEACDVEVVGEKISAYVRKQPETIGTDTVGMVTLDALKLPALGLLKLDLEGYEYWACLGGQETIQAFRPVIIMEEDSYSHRYDGQKHSAEELLESWGYRCVWRSKPDRIYIHSEEAHD